VATSGYQIRRTQPLYLQMADRLAADIASGLYPVESLLPPEADLCKKFDASRFTVREAIKQLQSMGLVATRQGTGTKVVARVPTGGRFVYSFDSVNDLRHSARVTRLVDIIGEEVAADRSMAEKMRCKVRQPLLRIVATRVLAQPKGRSAVPVAIAEMLVPLKYAEVLAELPNYDKTLSDLLEERFGVQTARIEQIVEPCTVSASEARKLGVSPGSLGLRFQRTYLNPKGEVFEHATSVQAGNEAKLSMTIRANTSR
jgi:GntR family transcriptional regulator